MDRFMYKITNKLILADGIKRLDIHAPELAARVRPGQFVVVTPARDAERIPLTVADHDVRRGLITLIVQETGETTRRLGDTPIGEEIFSILGPLGRPSRLESQKFVICVATGIGAAQILPICRALKEKECKLIGIIGAKTKKKIMLESQMRLTCHKIYITTEDGTYERRGRATDLVRELLDRETVDAVYAIGSVEMMQAVSEMTLAKNIPTRVGLNPVMLDGTGTCGSCRVKIGEEEMLACIEGPEFDGHQVDFDYLNIRMNALNRANV
jgi:ferredoxin--NADP+ reductase